MFSPAVKDPDGSVIVIVVEDGLLIIEAVTVLVPPVIVSPTVKLVEAPTVAVTAPIGYVATEEEEDSRARGCVICSTVHIFKPLFDHSAKRRFKDRLEVAASYPVRNSRPHLSKASSVISAMSRLKSTVPEVAITNSYYLVLLYTMKNDRICVSTRMPYCCKLNVTRISARRSNIRNTTHIGVI